MRRADLRLLELLIRVADRSGRVELTTFELGERLELARETVTRSVQRLERAGLVRCARPARLGRATTYHVTEEGCRTALVTDSSAKKTRASVFKDRQRQGSVERT